eukprot:CAMPEP_0182572380 /NCGR_PEP_ID=MMETSP1324-20130603/16146_1 /TAXON_ID=236786 /ORGANISM="Florenciella sp., Strain RCC1587" /LENGTH=145 /DNA_ID=CAMNT_0024787255 /DNA_START=82 /DNA_END=519 /DNA_ORIENTATION=+
MIKTLFMLSLFTGVSAFLKAPNSHRRAPALHFAFKDNNWQWAAPYTGEDVGRTFFALMDFCINNSPPSCSDSLSMMYTDAQGVYGGMEEVAAIAVVEEESQVPRRHIDVGFADTLLRNAAIAGSSRSVLHESQVGVREGVQQRRE